MGELISGTLNFNDSNFLHIFIAMINRLAQDTSQYYYLRFKPTFYFEVIGHNLPYEAGWYLILQDKTPIYVGKADNLNNRLNANNGTIDNFANKQRSSDPERNIIKKYSELGVFNKLRVLIISEKTICSELHFDANSLTELDRTNIEKILNIFRHFITFK